MQWEIIPSPTRFDYFFANAPEMTEYFINHVYKSEVEFPTHPTDNGMDIDTYYLCQRTLNYGRVTREEQKMDLGKEIAEIRAYDKEYAYCKALDEEKRMFAWRRYYAEQSIQVCS